MLFLFVLQFFGKIYIMKSFWKLYKTINKYISGNVTAFFAQSALKEKFSTQRALGRHLEGTWTLREHFSTQKLRKLATQALEAV